ncbi:hypothetical protein GQ53DRAFT_761139 [Thozetella sp. PMI_491]|nr:hypothetical protein GQ53DRAFT_761139 [Thozetella sp. PMI_491]
MFDFTIATAIFLLGIASAAPMPGGTVPSCLNYPTVPVTFNGAAGTSYTIFVLANGSPVNTNNVLSITSISMEGRASFTCVADGIDGSRTYLVANQGEHCFTERPVTDLL